MNPYNIQNPMIFNPNYINDINYKLNEIENNIKKLEQRLNNLEKNNDNKELYMI